MILITGLGNPEEKHKNTPHNIGFEVIDLLKEKFDFPDFSLNQNTLVSKMGDIILIKPQTYMNESGKAVKDISSFYKIKAEDVWVVQDENNIKLGEFKIDKNIPAKGHNGIKSIIERLGTQDFVRFRVGIKINEECDLTDYVLKPFTKENQEIINSIINNVALAIDEATQNGIQQAMLKFNKK